MLEQWSGPLLEQLQSLLLLGLLQVELKFFALEDVSVNASALSWSGRDASEEMSGGELIEKLWLKLVVLALGGELGLDVAGSLGAFACLIRFFKSLLVKLHIVSLEVPLSEGTGIDEDDGVLDEGLGTDELVVGRVVDGVHHTSSAGDGLRSPGEVTMVVLKSSGLDVSTTSLDEDHSLGADFGHGWDSSHFEISLFLVNWHAATSGSPLVPGVPRNTHTS